MPINSAGVSMRTMDIESVCGALRSKIAESGTSLAELILLRRLYLRVSVVGNCNLSCAFCHNEGNPTSGQLKISDAELLSETAWELGFRRIQITGGEPLVSKQLDSYIQVFRRRFDDVGVTTNGTLLLERISSLVDAGLSRLHISLQRQSLAPESGGRWCAPDWLCQVLKRGKTAGIHMRINIPVAPSDLPEVADFIAFDTGIASDLLLFSLLPEGEEIDSLAYVEKLKAISASENEQRNRKSPYAIFVRDYIVPNGIRCSHCSAKAICAESSRSLRVATDLTLRPCLATRQWDLLANQESLRRNLEMAALMAIDY